MATSGIVGGTQFNVAKLIEHALRRCGLPVSSQSAEILDIAKQNIFTMLLSSANRGFYLWCLEKQFIGLHSNKASYDMPIGTVDVSDVVFSTPNRVQGVDTTTSNSYMTQLDSANTIVRLGIKFSTIATTETVIIESSNDGVLWTSVNVDTRTNWVSGNWYWIELDPTVTASYFRLSTVAASMTSEFYLASAISDLPITPFNRDTYSSLVNKHTTSDVCTNYMIEKKVLPTVTLWPVPAGEYNHLTVWVHRQIQDIGSFTNEVEIPNRWLEAVIWQLAFRLSVELPGVDPNRISMLSQMADKYLIEAEKDETDGMPSFMQPSIGVYTQ